VGMLPAHTQFRILLSINPGIPRLPPSGSIYPITAQPIQPNCPYVQATFLRIDVVLTPTQKK
jgi:hypothetical protein